MSDQITSHKYWKEVRGIAEGLAAEARSGELGTGEQAREELSERLWETIDGHEYVIYTYKAQTILSISPNDGYGAENFGVEAVVTDGAINWSALAFGALYADVQEALWNIDGFDVNDPYPDPDDEDED